MNIKKILVSGAAAALMFGTLAAGAFAATTYTNFGDSAVVSGGNPGNADQIRSDSSIAPNYGGADFVVPSGLTFQNLTSLSSDYKITSGDCGGGAPRFQINVDGKNVFVYIGPVPNFTGCTPNVWQSTGNLIGSTDTRFDLSQYGGPFYGTYADALSLLGTHTVSGIQLVTDGYWAVTGSIQTVLIDNVNINGVVTTFDPVVVGPPTDMNQCKKDGWKTFNSPAFKNQGACVSYVQSNEHAGKRLMTFNASDSLYYNGPDSTYPLYGTGAFTFTWDPISGNVIAGSYNEVVPPTTGTTYYNVVTSGNVVGNTVSLTFDRTVPNTYHFTFSGNLSGNVLTGQLDGPYYFTATGN